MFAVINTACLRAFGEAVTYEQPGQDPFALTVVWQEGRGQPTTAGCALADFPVVDGAQLAPRKDGDTVTREGKLYHVVGVDRRGGGWALLELRAKGNA